MQTGSINTNSTSSAFLATVDDQMLIQNIKVYQIHNNSDKDSFAAACAIRSEDGYILGSISTNKQHYMFSILPSDSKSLSNLQLSSNSFSGSELLDFDVSDYVSGHFAYYSKMVGGNKQVYVNWRRLSDPKNYMLYLRKDGYHTYHTKKQIGFNHFRLSGYVQQNISNPGKFLA